VGSGGLPEQLGSERRAAAKQFDKRFVRDRRHSGCGLATAAKLLGSLASVLLAGALLRAFGAKGLVPPEVVGDPRFLVSVGAGAAATVLLATRVGLPISTTHALEKAKCFTYQHIEDSRISEEEFNAYADNALGHEQDKGLPVHRFSRAEFEAIAPADFDIVHWQQFSYYRPEYLDRFARVHMVEPQDLVNQGNSQFMVLKKRAD